MNLASIKLFLYTRFRNTDKGILYGAFVLMVFGIFLLFASSPGAADRMKIEDNFHFVKNQLFYFIPTIICMFTIAIMPVKWIRILSVLGLLGGIMALILVLFVGDVNKGASRWLSILGFSLQPSEFVKPFFAVVCAWLMASARLIKSFPGYWISFALGGCVLFLLYEQPDFGMLLTVGAVFCSELFLSGISLWLVGILIGLFPVFGLIGYFTLPHVHNRINAFLNPVKGESYQVEKSLETLQNAGWFGKGPGEGVVKTQLPDAHTDFIMAVSAEEFGFLLTALIIIIFIYILIRGFWLIRSENNYFCQIAMGGLLTQITFQALVNMGSTLNLIPTKGMTLPFISYGGSSLVAMGIVFGLLLAFSRKKMLSKGLE